MVPLGSLLDQLSEARNSLFPELVRTRADGSTYIECMSGGCAREALDPQLHCDYHLDAAKRDHVAKLKALDNESPTERRARRKRETIEAHARRMAADAGQPDRWQHRAIMDRARALVEGRAAKKDLDEVF